MIGFFTFEDICNSTTQYLDYLKDNENDRDAEKAYMLQSGIYASAMEHGVLEQVTGIESVSTIKVLAYAQENGIAIHSITKENLRKETESLTVSEQVKEEIAVSVNSGKVVIIPEREITINQWSGVGYMVLDPNTFACGYMISGGLAGGAMTVSEFLTAVALNVLYGLGIMLGCMLVIYVLPIFAPLFIIMACVSAICTGFSIGTHIGNFINTGDVRELQEGMVELATFCLLVGIGEKLGDLLNNSETIKKTAEEVTEAVKNSSDSHADIYKLNKSDTAGTVTKNHLSQEEYMQAQEIVEFMGGHFEGQTLSNTPGIDGYLNDVPVSLKEYSGQSMSGVLTHASKAESQVIKANLKDVDLYINAKNIGMNELIDFANKGPLVKIPKQGYIRCIYIQTSEGWIVIK